MTERGRSKAGPFLTIGGLVLMAVGAFAVYQLPTTLGQRPRAAAAQNSTAAAVSTITLTVDGMTCAACAKALAASFRKASGVVSAEVDYTKKQAAIAYDPGKQSGESLRGLVRQAGYQCQ